MIKLSQNLEIQNLNVILNNGKNTFQVLQNIHINIEEGELVSILGPSGCGKTTLLRVIAGLEKQNSGSILIGNRDITNLPAHQRNIGLIFQDYALFPHLNVKENILLGLKSNDYSLKFFKEITELVKIESLLSRYPHQLSGGQQQRVAIVRSIIREPQIILLDEPFSGLDKNLKREMAKELRSIFKKLNMKAILVTHDQEEAFSFSDEIGVIMNGQLVQWSTPFELYHSPNTRSIAEFIGETSFIKINRSNDNTFTCAFKLLSQSHSDIKDGFLMVRPDDIILQNNTTDLILEDKDTNLESADLIHTEFKGAYNLHTLQLITGEQVKALSPSHHFFPINSKVNFYVKMDKVIIFN